MKYLDLILFSIVLLITSCATSLKVLESDFQKLTTTKTGVLLTLNLETNGRVRKDKECYLTIDDGKEKFELLIKRGLGDYALPMLSTTDVTEITKISCGPFYFYNLKDQGATFRIRDQKIKYIGFINFNFQDKGNLEWGHALTNKSQLRDRAESMGIDKDFLEIDLLKL